MMKTTLGVVGAIVLLVALSIGGWKLYWYAHRSAVNQEYSINREGQPMQAGMIAHARDLSAGYHNAVDPAQKRQIAQQFCAIVQNVSAVPPDLAADRSEMC